MTVQSACIFPQTIVNEKFLGLLLPVFPSLVYLKPTEEPHCPQEKETPAIAELLNEKRLELPAPAPLGPLLERFNAMIKDIESNRENFAGQLVHLGGTRLSSGKTETLSSIKTSLSRNQLKDKGEEELIETLWKARLILKLAEIQDQEQEEIRRELETLHAKQHDLFHELRQETVTGFQLTSPGQNNLRTDSPGFKHRLRAWTRLFILGDYAPRDCRIFITQSVDAADLLLEKAQQQGYLDIEAARSIELDLPEGRQGEITDVNPKLETFWMEVLEDRRPEEASSSPLPLPGAIQDNTNPQLYVYPVQGVSPAELFRLTFTSDRPPINPQPEEAAHRWLVVLLQGS